MKMIMEDKDLDRVTGGLNFVYTKDVRRALIAEEEAARREAEQDVYSMAPTPPAGILGEMADLENLLISLR